MRTLGQIAYEYHNRRNQEAPDWDVLVECLQARWEHTACHVAAAVEPTMDTLRAELECVRAESKQLYAELDSAYAAVRRLYEALALAGIEVPS